MSDFLLIFTHCELPGVQKCIPSLPFPCAVSRQFLAKRLKWRAFVRDDSSCCSSLSAFFNDFSYLHFRFVSQCADAFSQK